MGVGTAVFQVVPAEGLENHYVLNVENPLRGARIGSILYAFGAGTIRAADLSRSEPLSSIRLV